MRMGEDDVGQFIKCHKWCRPLCCRARGSGHGCDKRPGVSQRKGDRKEFNNIRENEVVWKKLALVIGKYGQGHPSPLGRSADKAWAPVREERVQTVRHRHAGRGELGRGRWCG